VLPFSEDFDAEKIHVYSATEVVFLCGGPFSLLSEPIPLSLRDAFLKISDYAPLRDRVLLQAEEITSAFSFFEHYDNILDFETDLAQVVELIILFCESEGSLAELGAFAMIDEIAQRLFVIVRHDHWRENSFVKLGPLRRIHNKYGRASIYVIEENDIGMRGNDASRVDKAVLANLLSVPLARRLQRARDPSTFDPSRSGHVIKLIVGLVQEYGALDIDEIISLLVLLNAARTDQQVRGYLLCGESVGWLKKVSRGSSDYFVAVRTRFEAAAIPLKATAEIKNKTRRRFLIREHWKRTDPERHKGIAQIFGLETHE
jgi:hypothetical protein